MKSIFKYIGLLLLSWVGLSSCYKDVIAPPIENTNTPPQFESFSNDIQPIFSSNCALSGCHVQGSQTPYLQAGIAYQDLISGGFINTVIPTQSYIYIMINGDMEVHIPSATQRQAIFDWIRDGAQNN